MSSLIQVHVLLMMVGGILLVSGLVTPWYFLSIGGKNYYMSAMGGGLVGELASESFNSMAAYISLCFAIISIMLSFVSVKLPDISQRKYVAVLSCSTGICALMNIVYIHSWLDTVFPNIPFICYASESGCGPMVGYFLTWVAMVLLFASTYVSQGLAQVSIAGED